MDKYYNALKDSIQEGIIVFTKDGSVLDINKNIEMTMDCVRTDNCRLDMILPENISRRISEMISTLEKNGFSVPIPISIVNKNGVRIPFWVVIESIGENVYLAVFKELISNEEMHKFAWENEIKGRYLSKISKSLYLPLHNLERDLEYAEDAVNAVEHESVADFVTDARKETRKILDIFEEILDLSIIDTVTNKMLFKTVDLKSVLDKAIGIVSADLVNIEFQHDNSEYKVLGDVKALEYLFLTAMDLRLQYIDSSDKIVIEMVKEEGHIKVLICGHKKGQQSRLESILAQQDDISDFESIRMDIAKWIVRVHNIALHFHGGCDEFVFAQDSL